MLHAVDDDLLVSSAPAHPHTSAETRADGARPGLRPHSLSPWGEEVVVDAVGPAHSRAGRRW